MSPHNFEDDFHQAKTLHGLEESDRQAFSKHWSRNPQNAGRSKGIETLAGVTRALRGAPSAPPAVPGTPRVKRPDPPPSLDEEGRNLYAKVEARADELKTDFYAAMAKVTGVLEYADLGPRLMSDRELEEIGPSVDPEGRSTDQAARVLMRSAAISYADAAEVVELMRQLADAKAQTGAAEVPWRDTRKLAKPPVPWSTDDWERDRRRAARAGMEINLEEWQAMAEEGRDYVGEQAEEARRERVAELEQQLASRLKDSQDRELGKRAEAIERELRRRADERLQKAQRRGHSPGWEPSR